MLQSPVLPILTPAATTLQNTSKYCLRTNRKRLAGTHDKDRDRQFRYLVRQRHRYLKHGWPVISVDTKTCTFPENP